jgi:hypothetical protein
MWQNEAAVQNPGLKPSFNTWLATGVENALFATNWSKIGFFRQFSWKTGLNCGWTQCLPR